MKVRVPAVALLVLAAACSEGPVHPTIAANDAAPSLNHSPTHHVFTSGAHVTAWDPIIPTSAYANWQTTVCTSQPLVGPNAAWQNPHNAFVLHHPWVNDFFTAPWINAWNSIHSVGPEGHNWTKYETTVTGHGSNFVIRLLADNCSWIYLDGTLVGVQGTDLTKNSYGLTLNGTHTLTFIIFDGGGAAGGKFLLETSTDPPPPLNPPTIKVTGTNGTLTITGIGLLVSELELEADDNACDGLDKDGCQDFEAEPQFVQLPLSGDGDFDVTSTEIPPGTYQELEFEVEALEGEQDNQQIQALFAAIRAKYPRFPEEASMVVTGDFNGTPFRVYFDAEMDVDMDLVPSLQVTGSGASRPVLVKLQPKLWFLRDDGTVLDLTQFDFDGTGKVPEFELEIDDGVVEVEIN